MKETVGIYTNIYIYICIRFIGTKNSFKHNVCISYILATKKSCKLCTGCTVYLPFLYLNLPNNTRDGLIQRWYNDVSIYINIIIFVETRSIASDVFHIPDFVELTRTTII